MTATHRELVLLAVVFVAVVWFIYTQIASDLPDDFIAAAQKRIRKAKEKNNGGIRDNG